MHELPPLPEAAMKRGPGSMTRADYFTADQMRAYAAAAVAAERARCVDIVETYAVSVGNSRAGELAAEWTMNNLREVRDAIRGVRSQ